MMKATMLTLALFLAVGFNVVDADDGPCYSLVNNLSENTACDYLFPYIYCLIKNSGLGISTNPNDQIIHLLKIEFDSYLSELGTTCNFDIQSMVQQTQGIQPTINIPTDYNNATSDAGCLGVLLNHNDFSCSEFSSYFKCSIRVSDVLKLSSDFINEAISGVQTKVNSILSKFGLHCHVNMKSIVNDILHGNNGPSNGGHGFLFSYRPFHLVTLVTFTALSFIVLY